MDSIVLKKRQTLKKSFILSGVGLFTGKQAQLKFEPSKASSGIRFISTAQGSKQTIEAKVENVLSTQRNTTLGVNGISVQTVEHVMSAFAGLGVDDVDVFIDGPEIPILDGSSLEFIQAINEVGLAQKSETVKVFEIDKPLRVASADAYIALFPSNSLSVHYTLSYPQEEFLRGLYYTYNHTLESYVKEISPARTFSPLSDIQAMSELKMVRPESLKSSLIIDGSSVVAYEGLRFDDEPVRHKILDLLGDLYISGVRFRGSIYAAKSGHTLDYEMAKLLSKEYLGESP